MVVGVVAESVSPLPSSVTSMTNQSSFASQICRPVIPAVVRSAVMAPGESLGSEASSSRQAGASMVVQKPMPWFSVRRQTRPSPQSASTSQPTKLQVAVGTSQVKLIGHSKSVAQPCTHMVPPKKSMQSPPVKSAQSVASAHSREQRLEAKPSRPKKQVRSPAQSSFESQLAAGPPGTLGTKA